MKSKFDLDNYLQNFVQNDIQMVEKIKATMTIKSVIVCCIWYAISLFVIFEFCNVLYIKLSFLSFSILLMLLTYLNQIKYIQNKTEKLLIKNYFIRAFMGILGVTMNAITITLFSSNDLNPELWISFICCLSFITLTFSYLINNKYMQIKNTETLTISAITGGCISYLIVRKFTNYMMCLLAIMILIIVVSSLSEHIIRSIRLLKYAPKEILDHTE